MITTKHVHVGKAWRTPQFWLLWGILCLNVSAGIGVYLSRRLTRPVDALAHSAVRLGAGDFSARSPRSGVPELDEVADALDATADRLGNALARERAFSADASHQLRTPLTALRVQLESGALHASPDTSPILHAALSEIDRLDHTIDDLLALARDEHGPRSLLDLQRILDSVADAWRGPLATAGRPLTVRAEANLPPVLASEAAIRQVLDVLAANAVAHGAGEVAITARRAPGGLAIEVTDEGPGLTGDPEQAFVRRSTNGEGHGIGLALARSLTEAEGGRLVIEHARPNPIFAVILTTTSE
jgi:signal transduction histidine kinase